MKHAVTIDGDFTWETAGKLEANKFAASREGKGPKRKGEAVLPTSAAGQVGGTEIEGSEKKTEEKPFELKNVKFSVPKGAFVAIVGRVGSGKVCSLVPIQRLHMLISFAPELVTSRAHWRNAENARRGIDPCRYVSALTNDLSVGCLWWNRLVRTADGLDSKRNPTRERCIWSRGR